VIGLLHRLDGALEVDARVAGVGARRTVLEAALRLPVALGELRMCALGASVCGLQRLEDLVLEHVGSAFDGIVSGVTSFGLFVELKQSQVSGLVHITQLPNDYYHFDPVRHMLSGERRGLKFRLGDAVRVQVLPVTPKGIITYTPQEIITAYRLLASREGIFCEPASAASVAGLLKYGADGAEQVVCVLTGRGLKDPETALANNDGRIIQCVAETAAIERLIRRARRRNSARRLAASARASRGLNLQLPGGC